MAWIWFALDVCGTIATWACWVIVVLSAALCPFLTATAIVELRNLRQVVDLLEARPACRCHHRHPLFHSVEGLDND